MGTNIQIRDDLRTELNSAANMAVLDRRGTIIAVNDAWKSFARANGYRGSAFGVGANYLAICRAAAEAGADGAETAHAALEGLLAGRTRMFSIEYPCHAPGEDRWFQMIALPNADPGRDGQFLVLHLPITERKQAERRILEARRDTERAAAAKSRFLATAAGDLRQAAQAAMMFYQLLPEEPRAEAADQARVRLGRCLESLRDSLDGLTDLSRLESGMVSPRPEVFAADALLESLWVEFAPVAEARGIDFRRVPSSAFAETDPALVATVLRNLLTNATTYARGSKVLLGCRRSGSSLRLTVADAGPGIAERETSLIFEDFYRGEHFGHDRTRGLGLGLSVARRVAASLGERLTVRSRPGHGSIFEMTVPRAGAARPTVDGGRLDASPLRGRLVAVLDDDAAALDHLRLYYKFLGHDVLAAASGPSAILQLRRQRRIPDAIVASGRLNGAGEGGEEAIRQIRRAFDRTIPGILLTEEAAPSGEPDGAIRVMQRTAARDLAMALDEILSE